MRLRTVSVTYGGWGLRAFQFFKFHFNSFAPAPFAPSPLQLGLAFRYDVPRKRSALPDIQSTKET